MPAKLGNNYLGTRRAKNGAFSLEWALCPSFRFEAIVFSHGWYELEPLKVISATDASVPSGPFSLQTVLSHEEMAWEALIAIQGEPKAEKLVVKLHKSASKWTDQCRRQLTRMFRLDEDFEEFWQRLRSDAQRRWLADQYMGPMLRSASLAEDLIKILMTTNCSWAATQSMCKKLCMAFGVKTSQGSWSFPSISSLDGISAVEFREEIGCGYRAPYLVALIAWLKDCDQEDFEAIEDPQILRSELGAIPGFGPYAVGQALRMMGHYEDLALDSWCRAGLQKLWRKKSVPNDAEIRAHYAGFAPYQGLCMWFDLVGDRLKGVNS